MRKPSLLRGEGWDGMGWDGMGGIVTSYLWITGKLCLKEKLALNCLEFTVHSHFSWTILSKGERHNEVHPM